MKNERRNAPPYRFSLQGEKKARIDCKKMFVQGITDSLRNPFHEVWTLIQSLALAEISLARGR
jgi:hypothetical protein